LEFQIEGTPRGSFHWSWIFDAGTGSRNLNDDADEKREISSTKIGDCNSHAVPDPLEEPLLEERFLDARHNVQDCDLQQRETNPRSGQEKKFNNQENLTENARLNDHRVKLKEGFGGSRRRRPGSRGWISLDMDSSTGKESISALSVCKLNCELMS